MAVWRAGARPDRGVGPSQPANRTVYLDSRNGRATDRLERVDHQRPRATPQRTRRRRVRRRNVGQLCGACRLPGRTTRPWTAVLYHPLLARTGRDHNQLQGLCPHRGPGRWDRCPVRHGPGCMDALDDKLAASRGDRGYTYAHRARQIGTSLVSCGCWPI